MQPATATNSRTPRAVNIRLSHAFPLLRRTIFFVSAIVSSVVEMSLFPGLRNTIVAVVVAAHAGDTDDSIVIGGSWFCLFGHVCFPTIATLSWESCSVGNSRWLTNFSLHLSVPPSLSLSLSLSIALLFRLLAQAALRASHGVPGSAAASARRRK